MRCSPVSISAAALVAGLASRVQAHPASVRNAALDPTAYAARWKNGLPADTGFFPIAVWLQSPSNAAKYKQAGVNLYIGLWEGPTQAQLAALTAAGMRVVCDQNAVGLQNRDSKTIVGWMHGDEPDNAQARADGNGYDPCIDPTQIISGYAAMRAADSTRPVLLNLGRGVAVTDWIGRGTCTGKTDMYARYAQGADFLSFDVYPVNSSEAKVRGNLWYVPLGVDSLARWSGGTKPVMAWIEATRIAETPADKPTPAQTRSEVWMALIHGAMGIGYFCHSFYPSTVEAAFLEDKDMLAGITAVNRQIQSLAPVLNSPTLGPASSVTAASVVSSVAAVPIDVMVKYHGGFTYVFAAAMRPGATTGTFRVPNAATVEVEGEGRALPASGGTFSDAFSDYGVHVYKVSASGSGVIPRRIAGAGGGADNAGRSFVLAGPEASPDPGLIRAPGGGPSGVSRRSGMDGSGSWLLDAQGRFRGAWDSAEPDAHGRRRRQAVGK